MPKQPRDLVIERLNRPRCPWRWWFGGALVSFSFVLLSHSHSSGGVGTPSSGSNDVPLAVTPLQSLRRSFSLSTPIDVAFTDPASLRRVARARAVDRGRGPELFLLATDDDGGALALNALLNLHAVGYSSMVLVVAYLREACPRLGAAAEGLSSTAARAALQGTPCVHDSWWEAHLRRHGAGLRRSAAEKEVYGIQIDVGGPGRWLIRWAAVARLTRLGYNVLCVDTDAASPGRRASLPSSDRRQGRRPTP